MATVGQFPAALGVTLAALAGCDDLGGLEPTAPTPLASLHVRVTGAVEPGTESEELRVGLSWLYPWITDPSCLPPAENPQHAAVMAAGCVDPLAVSSAFAFDAAGAVVAADRTATLDLFDLPTALFGDNYAQIAYASIVVRRGGTVVGSPFPTVYVGASFSSMARPDTRLAFRNGGFDERLGFYPRRGCGAPPQGFSVVSAGGFTIDQAIEAQARGELPLEDPASCREDSLDRTVDIALQPPEELDDLSCYLFGGVFYSPPPPAMSGDAIMACTSLRDRAAGKPSDRTQVLISGMVRSQCAMVQHYILRGCFIDPFCDAPDWDMPQPSWWPCPAEAR